MGIPSPDPHTAPLTPGDAAAALLTVDGCYLLQLRDADRPIFFPGHWGLFGGGVEPGETALSAIRRELQEELALSVAAEDVHYFTHFTFDFGFSDSPVLSRVFYEIEISQEKFSQLHLSEGKEMRLFRPSEIFGSDMMIAPYDAFALWMHHNRARLMPAQKTLIERRGG